MFTEGFEHRACPFVCTTPPPAAPDSADPNTPDAATDTDTATADADTVAAVVAIAFVVVVLPPLCLNPIWSPIVRSTEERISTTKLALSAQ
jgi:hypothetical protein